MIFPSDYFRLARSYLCVLKPLDELAQSLDLLGMRVPEAAEERTGGRHGRKERKKRGDCQKTTRRKKMILFSLFFLWPLAFLFFLFPSQTAERKKEKRRRFLFSSLFSPFLPVPIHHGFQKRSDQLASEFYWFTYAGNENEGREDKVKRGRKKAGSDVFVFFFALSTSTFLTSFSVSLVFLETQSKNSMKQRSRSPPSPNST